MGRPKGSLDTKPRQPRLSPEIRAEIMASAAERLKVAYEKAVDLWAKILDDEDEPTANRIAASDRIAAYAIGKPGHREASKDSDTDAVRAITEARKTLESDRQQKLLPQAPQNQQVAGSEKSISVGPPMPEKTQAGVTFPDGRSGFLEAPSASKRLLTPMERFGWEMDS